MDVPGVGTARGAFDLFMPGAFLLANAVGIAYACPHTTKYAEEVTSFAQKSHVLATLAVICAAYLLGVLMRMALVDPVDRCSVRWIRWFGKPADDLTWELYAGERFPYIEHLGEICERRLSDAARRFWERTWKPRLQGGGSKHNKEFFRFCRTLLYGIGSGAVAEIYAYECLCRYIASTFYALFASWCLALLAVLATPFSVTHHPVAVFPALTVLEVLIVAYTGIMWFMLLRFHRVRILEAQIVFVACLARKDEIEPLLI